MQDRTIDNALLALARRGGEQAELARAILALRGVPLPLKLHDRPLSRGACRRLVLACLPCTSTVLADRIQERLPGISRKSACQRAYMALRRLEDAGKVRRVGRVWASAHDSAMRLQNLVGASPADRKISLFRISKNESWSS